MSLFLSPLPPPPFNLRIYAFSQLQGKMIFLFVYILFAFCFKGDRKTNLDVDEGVNMGSKLKELYLHVEPNLTPMWDCDEGESEGNKPTNICLLIHRYLVGCPIRP